MRGLFLHGANCNVGIWDFLRPDLTDFEIEYLAYSEEITRSAESVGEIARWVSENCAYSHYDFVLGHSMGGFVALHLASGARVLSPKLILLESNPKPSNAFYRNLMTDAHMKEFGAWVMQMLRREAESYNPILLGSLRDGYDETDHVRRYEGEIHAILGDRGNPEYPGRISDLCLEQDIADRIHFHFIEDSCHLPMIENPKALARMIREIALFA